MYGSRMASFSGGGGSSVSERKKFFENCISEQKQRESLYAPPSVASTTSRTTDSCMSNGSRTSEFLEERSDSESLFHNISDRTDPDESYGTFGTFFTKSGSTSDSDFHHFTRSESDSEPDSDVNFPLLFEQENIFYESNEKNTSLGITSINCDEDVKGDSVPQSHSYLQKAQSLDEKLLPFLDEELEEEPGSQAFVEVPNHSSDLTSTYGRVNTFEEFDAWVSNHITSCSEKKDKAIEQENEIQRGDEESEIQRVVKIQVTTTPAPTKDFQGVDDFAAKGKKNIDVMIAEFQKVSSELSKELSFTPPTSRSNSDDYSNSQSYHASNQINEIPKDSTTHPTNSAEESLSYNSLPALSIDDINILKEIHEKQLPTDVCISKDYVCASESTDCSIDSLGNAETTKSVCSRSGKSLGSLRYLRRNKGEGMGKMLKRAKKGMGKSAKNISSLMKKTVKSKTAKELSANEKQASKASADHNQYRDFFNEKLAELLMRRHKGISKASQYLTTGKNLLNNGAQYKKNHDFVRSKEMIQKAHTYAFVGRQLAKQYLLEHQDEIYDSTTMMTQSDLTSSENEDAINAFEDFFFSFLHCVGPCYGYEDNHGEIQVHDTLEILSKVSEEETDAINRRLPNNGTVNDGKEKIRAAIERALQQTDSFDQKDEHETAQDRNLAIRQFLSDLQSFYQVDTFLNLSSVALSRKCTSESTREGNSSKSQIEQDGTDETEAAQCSGSQEEGSQESKFSMISKSLSDNCSGRSSFLACSVSTTRSMRPEKTVKRSRSKEREGRKEESQVKGIEPGTTVLKIPMKKRGRLKNKTKPTNDNKKKKWLSAIRIKRKA